MKKLLLLPLLLGMLLTGCGKETNPGGNTPGGDQPVTGTFTFEMPKMGWESGQENPKVTANPGLTITADKGENKASAPKYWEGTDAEDKSLRLYALNTLTLSASEIIKIEFTYTIKDSQTMSPNVGSLSSNIWTGSSSSVTFTLGSKGQIRITEMKVTGTFSGGGSTPVDPVDPGDERTVASVANDIASNLNIPATSIEWGDEEDAYMETSFSNVSSLKEACEAGITYLPNYLSLDTAPYAGTWQEGDDGYFAYYVDSANAIYVEIGSYLENNIFYTQFCVFYGY